MRQVFFDSRKASGSPRVHLELVKASEPIGRHRVAQILRQGGLDARPKPKKRGCGTDSRDDRGFVANLIGRHFDVEAPNRAWVGDVKYIETDEGFVYLDAFTDLFSRRNVGRDVAEHKQADLPIDVLRRAFALRAPALGLIVHTDRGASQSMSRKVNCYDNAVAESFFASLAKDLVMRHRFRTKREVIAATGDYIRNFYSRHSATLIQRLPQPRASRASLRPDHGLGRINLLFIKLRQLHGRQKPHGQSVPSKRARVRCATGTRSVPGVHASEGKNPTRFGLSSRRRVGGDVDARCIPGRPTTCAGTNNGEASAAPGRSCS